MSHSKKQSIVIKREVIEKDCRLWAESIGKEYNPDLIIFVAKSGYLFAKPMAEIFECEMADIVASRSQNSIKDSLKWIINILPEKVLLSMLNSPFMYKFNNIKKERNVEITERFLLASHKNYKKILIVDDSVDTGWTILLVKEKVKEFFSDAELKIASYTVIEESKKLIDIDYYRYENKVILTATSRKSDQYDAFINEFEKWKIHYLK